MHLVQAGVRPVSEGLLHARQYVLSTSPGHKAPGHVHQLADAIARDGAARTDLPGVGGDDRSCGERDADRESRGPDPPFGAGLGVGRASSDGPVRPGGYS